MQKILSNTHCKGLFDVLGCNIGKNCSAHELRYRQIFIVTDGDIDGHHSRHLLIRLFQLYLSPLIFAKKVHVIPMPAYRIDHSSEANDDFQPEYLYSDAEKLSALEWHRQNKEPAPSLSQLKGLGSYRRDELLQLVLQKDSRQSICLSVITKSQEVAPGSGPTPAVSGSSENQRSFDKSSIEQTKANGQKT